MRQEPGRGAWWLAAGAVVAILLAPLAIADVPPVLDYPNHLARMVLLAAGSNDPVLSAIATPAWGIIPNLAGDAIGVPLLRWLPVHVAGRFLLGLALLLNLAGVLALHRAWFGRRSLWPLGAGLVSYNATFLLGFLNWEIGSGLAMLCAAVWMVWRERRPAATIIFGGVAAVALFFCHLMGVAFFLLLIGSAELRAMRGVRSIVVRSAGLLLVASGPLLLSALTTARVSPIDWPRWDVKLVNGVSPFINYVLPLDLITALLVYGGIAWGLAAGWLVPAPRAIVAAIVLPVAYLALPFDLMSASFLDMRVAVMLGYLAFAGVDTVRLDPVRWGRWMVAGCACLFVVRMALLADVWSEQRLDLGELRAVIAAVPPGAKVYVTNVPPEEAPAYWDAGPRVRRLANSLRMEYHLPALLLIEHRAFWPVLFANPGQQPIRLTPEYALLAREAHDIPSHAELVSDPDRALPALRDFDFVLLLEAGATPSGFPLGCLGLVTRSDFAALFRIERQAAHCTAVPPGG